MSFASALARVAELQSALAPPQAAQSAAASSGSGGFAEALQAAGGTTASATAANAGVSPGVGGGRGAAALVAAAAGEVGQAEAPAGSNNSSRIVQYRDAVPGGPVGPWCAYFASWAARQAGMPLGERGQGFASVDAVWSWAQRSGRTTSSPSPGDLIVWDEHIGVVERVLPDGRIATIEGNSSDRVARRVRSPQGVVGYVRPG